MIAIVRWPAPPEMAAIAEQNLVRIRPIARLAWPTKHDIGIDYRSARRYLRFMQALKCAYCERRLPADNEDVEHFRPKSLVRRRTKLRDIGYYWLSWTWDNLLFVCRRCNTKKGSWFRQLGDGPSETEDWQPAPNSRLQPEQMPPGPEQPLMIDPTAIGDDDGPIVHICFTPWRRKSGERWTPTARNGSERGYETIKRLGLDGDDLIDLYREFAQPVVKRAESFMRLVDTARSARSKALKPQAVATAWADLCHDHLGPRCQYIGLAYDIISHRIPAEVRIEFGLTLDIPRLIVSEAVGLRSIIENVYIKLGIEPTPAQEAQLQTLEVDGLYQLLYTLDKTRAWPI